MIETLFRINYPSTASEQYLPYGHGVYFVKMTAPREGYGPYYSQWGGEDINQLFTFIGQVVVDREPYVKKASLSDCVGDDNSFYWDNVLQTLYVHFEFDKLPEFSNVTVYGTGGFSLIGTEKSMTINGIDYQPRIKTIPSIKKKVDKSQSGKMRFQDQSVTLVNGDGWLDGLVKQPLPGSEAVIALYDTDNDTELIYYTGVISADKTTTDDITLKITDKRRRDNRKIPFTRFSVDDFPSIEDKYVGKIIPEGYGAHIGIKCFPVNGDESSPTNITFKYATDATVLTEVRVKENDVWSTVSTASSTPADVEFELSSADATNSSGGLLPCVADVTLRAEVNPGDILKDMALRYNSVAFDATNYDLTEWASEKVKLADINLLMSKSREFFKVVEETQNGSDLFFLYDIDGAGKRTLRVNDVDRSVARTIRYEEIKNDLKPVERDFSEFSSSVTVLYAKNNQEDTYKRALFDAYEDEVIVKYGVPHDSEFKTLLTSSTDAGNKAELIGKDQREARPVATVVLHGDDLTKLSLKLYDIVTVELSCPPETYWSSVPDTMDADYTGADTMDADYTGSDTMLVAIGETKELASCREYWGEITGQIIGLGYDPDNLSYTLTIREVAI